MSLRSHSLPKQRKAIFSAEFFTRNTKGVCQPKRKKRFRNILVSILINIMRLGNKANQFFFRARFFLFLKFFSSVSARHPKNHKLYLSVKLPLFVFKASRHCSKHLGSSIGKIITYFFATLSFIGIQHLNQKITLSQEKLKLFLSTYQAGRGIGKL